MHPRGPTFFFGGGVVLEFFGFVVAYVTIQIFFFFGDQLIKDAHHKRKILKNFGHTLTQLIRSYKSYYAH